MCRIIIYFLLLHITTSYHTGSFRSYNNVEGNPQDYKQNNGHNYLVRSVRQIQNNRLNWQRRQSNNNINNNFNSDGGFIWETRQNDVQPPQEPRRRQRQRPRPQPDNDFFLFDDDDRNFGNNFIQTTPPPLFSSTVQIPGMGTPRSVCEDGCPATPEYNPVCGSDYVTYYNPSRLRCAQKCGKSVSIMRPIACPRF